MAKRNEPRNQRRVAVTGVGIVSPLGRSASEHWSRLSAGERAARWLPELAPPGIHGSAAAGWRPSAGAPALGFNTPPEDDVLERMAVLAADDALADAGLESLRELASDRRGCVLGVSKPLLLESRDQPLGAPCGLAEPSRVLAARYGIEGPTIVPSAACATGLISLIRGVDLIRDDSCDLVIAGSSDWSLSTAYLAGYRRLRVLAPPNDDPASACRPFDLRRNGFVVGCGAAVLVLEAWEHAVARGAKILVEWLGHAMAGDGVSMVDVDRSGSTPAYVVAAALNRAAIQPERIHAVSLHGTATRGNDLCETRGVIRALGDAAYATNCFSVKGSIGHLMGAAGSVETATLIMAMRHNLVPPTVNLEQADPDCPLNYTSRAARRREIDCAVKLSLGFGGACAAAVLANCR